jgi:predicted dinucleotide-binding enzyme
MAAAAAPAKNDKPCSTIAVLGSKDVGRRLAAGFASKGYQVLLGTRNTKEADLVKWCKEHGNGVALASNEEAVKKSEVVMIATKWDGTESAIKLSGVENFKEKVVIDATNPLGFDEKKRMILSISGQDSAGETVQKWLPNSKVVKCFNHINNRHMIDPKSFDGHIPDLLLCGNSADAKTVVTKLLLTVGFGAENVVDAGDITSSRYTEAMTVMWCRYAFATGNFNSAWALLRKKDK